MEELYCSNSSYLSGEEEGANVLHIYACKKSEVVLKVKLDLVFYHGQRPRMLRDLEEEVLAKRQRRLKQEATPEVNNGSFAELRHQVQFPCEMS